MLFLAILVILTLTGLVVSGPFRSEFQEELSMVNTVPTSSGTGHLSEPTTREISPDRPVGFPLPLHLRPMRVIENGGNRRVAPPAADGPNLVEVSRDLHPRPQNDFEANRFGWNCRVHEAYEGAPAVDWYLPEGTPVIAIMRGTAELYVITTANAFEYYGIDNSLMLALPKPSTPINPFTGHNGGLGIFVSIRNGDLRAEYGHLGLEGTLAIVPPDAFVTPYSASYDYLGLPRSDGHLR